MGVPDTVTYEYMKRNEVFADYRTPLYSLIY